MQWHRVIVVHKLDAIVPNKCYNIRILKNILVDIISNAR